MSADVLVVEDDADLRVALVELIEVLGFEARGAPDGQAALDAVRADRPALVLLDLVMPRMDGWTFLDRVRRDPALADLPVIVSTSAPQHAPAGVQVIAKPTDVRLLERCLERHVDRAG